MGETAADTATIPMLERGVWREIPHPAEDGSSDVHEMMRRAGFSIVTQLGPKPVMSIPVPLELVVWASNPTPPAGPTEPRYLVDIELPDTSETVAARDVTDLMDLLARWAPALQLSASTYDAFQHSEDGIRLIREAKEAAQHAKMARLNDHG